jgi:hypothetical protein
VCFLTVNTHLSLIVEISLHLYFFLLTKNSFNFVQDLKSSDVSHHERTEDEEEEEAEQKKSKKKKKEKKKKKKRSDSTDESDDETSKKEKKSKKKKKEAKDLAKIAQIAQVLAETMAKQGKSFDPEEVRNQLRHDSSIRM